MKFRVPLCIPLGQRVAITQLYGPSALAVEPPGPNGEPHFHYGIDLIVGDSHQTYGTAIVCPFPSAVITGKKWFGAMSDQNNAVDFTHEDEAGVKHMLRCYHVSGIEDIYNPKEGSTIAYVGNAGTVSPKPTLANPYAGSHLHLEYYVDGVVCDPLPHMDIASPYFGADTGLAKDAPPAEWVVSKLLDIIGKFTGQHIDWKPANQS